MKLSRYLLIGLLLTAIQVLILLTGRPSSTFAVSHLSRRAAVVNGLSANSAYTYRSPDWQPHLLRVRIQHDVR